jgi:hypothetical protein
LTEVFFFRIDLFSQFHPSTLDWLRIRVHDLFRSVFYEVILIPWSSHRFGRLILVDSSCFFVSFFNWFFHFHLSKLIWLRIESHKLFQFGFYWVILVSWPGSRVWQVNFSYFFLFFLINFFFNFIIRHWVYYKLSFIICFDLHFIELSWSHGLIYALAC